MTKKAKYKTVFKFAQKFLGDIISDHPSLNNSILEKHLQHQSEFNNISDANCRLIETLQNRSMMAKVINFKERKNEIRKILHGYNPEKILQGYKNANELVNEFKNKFNLNNLRSNRNLWFQFSEGILSGSKFMASFKDKKDFDTFIKVFDRNKFTKAALPMLLSKEIKGLGFALACDFLKELGYRDYPKPDTHLIEIFHTLGLSVSKEPYEVYKSLMEMSEAVGEDAYRVDKIFWLIGSGNFYLADTKTGRHREKFIKSVKASLEKQIILAEKN